MPPTVPPIIASSFVDVPLLDAADSASGAADQDKVSGAVSDIANGLFGRREVVDLCVEDVAPMAFCQLGFVVKIKKIDSEKKDPSRVHGATLSNHPCFTSLVILQEAVASVPT